MSDKQYASSLRIYLTLEKEDELEDLTSSIADLLVEKGYNNSEDDLETVIAVFPASEDVVLWSEDIEGFVSEMTARASEIIIPTKENQPEN